MAKFKKTTILTCAILLGIVAIGISAYVRYELPYKHELALEKLDGQRIRDLDSLNGVLQDVMLNDPEDASGTPNTVYISIPSDSPTCSDLNLPSLPQGWQYHCVTQSNLINLSGTGWIPINFPFLETLKIPALPVDPINNADTLNYYAFVMNNTGGPIPYALTGVLDSKKYIAEKAQTDGGTDPIRYELGSNFYLWADAQGLVGDWPMNRITTNNMLPDASGNGNDIALPLNQIYSQTSCLLDACIENNEASPVTMVVPSLLDTAGKQNISYGFWFKLKTIPATNIQIFNPGTNRLDVNIEAQTGSLFVWFYDVKQQNYQIYRSLNGQFVDDRWHQFFLTKDTSGITIYIDGQFVGKEPVSTLSDQNLSTGGLDLLSGMSINNLELYQRVLTAQEISMKYSAYGK